MGKSAKKTQDPDYWMSFLEKRMSELQISTETDVKLEFCKTFGSSTGEGVRYEEGSLALMFLRCLRERVQFSLSANDRAGGKFDDLVLCWNKTETPTNQQTKETKETRSASVLFVQLKHKTSAMETAISTSMLLGQEKDDDKEHTDDKKANKKKEKNDFSIQMYHKSSETIWESCKSLVGSSYALVLCTNLDLHDDARCMFEEADQAAWKSLLESGGTCYKLNSRDEKVKGVVQGVKDEGRFAEHFYLFCKQSNSKDLRLKIYEELKKLLGANETWRKAICEDLCCKLRERMNEQKICLTSKWNSWLKIVDKYVKEEVTACNSIVLPKIKYTDSCLEPLQKHIDHCNPAWIISTSRETMALTATKVHQIVSGKTHIVVSVTRLAELEKKISCCWGPFCRWLILIDDGEYSYNSLQQQAGSERHLVIVSYKGEGNEAFRDMYKSDDIDENSWKELLKLAIRLNSEQHQDSEQHQNSEQHHRCLQDLCGTAAALKAMLDRNPEALVALSQLSGPLRVGQKLDPLPGNHIDRKLISRMWVREDFFSSLGDGDVCIVDNASCEFLPMLENCLVDSDTIWPVFVVANNVDLAGVNLICSKYADTRVYVSKYGDDGWEIVLHSRGSAKVQRYAEEKSRSLLQVVNGSSKRVIIEGKPGVGKSTMLLDMAKQLKRQNPSFWVLRIDLLKYSEFFDNCDNGKEASKNILKQVVYNNGNVGVLEHSLLQHCLLEYSHIICLIDGFDEVCPDYAEICLQALEELSPRLGKLVVTTRPSMAGRLEDALGVIAHSLPAFSEEQLVEFHSRSLSEMGVTGNVRDLLKIPLFSRMYAESLDSGDAVEDIVSLYESFFEKKFRRLYEQKWCDKLFIAGKKEKIRKERMEHEKQLGYLTVRHLLPRLELPSVHSSSIDRDDLVKAGVIYHFINDKPVFIHRTFAEHFLAKWCFSDVGKGHCAKVYQTALCDNSLEFFVESFDRLASRNQLLLTTVLNGSESGVKAHLGKGVDLLEGDELGRNSMHLAAAYSRDSAILWLLIESLEIARAVKAEEDTVVEQMVEVVDLTQRAQALQAVTVALAEDCLLHWKPLRYAAERRRWGAVAALLEAGAQLRHLGDFQRGLYSPEELWTIFQNSGYDDLKRHILRKNGSIWTSGSFEHRVKNRRLLQVEVGATLACAKMSVEEYRRIKEEAIQRNDLEVAKLLMHKILDMEKRSTTDGSPKTMLHKEAEIGNVERLRQLIEEGEEVNARDSKCQTTLHCAALMGRLQCVKLLLDAGADVDALDSWGRRPLHLAAQWGNAACVRLLAREDPEVRDRQSLTALQYAARNGDAESVEHLLSARPHRRDTLVAALHEAAFGGDLPCVMLLVQEGADVAARNIQGSTALVIAVRQGHADCARHLLKEGASANQTDPQGNTPLHHAAMKGRADCVKLLLDTGADTEQVNEDGHTPAYYADKSGDAECLRLLTESRALETHSDHVSFMGSMEVGSALGS